MHIFMSWKALTENNRWQSCCTKIQSPGSYWQWVMTSQRQIYTPPSLKFRFHDTGSRISFLCTVMLLTRLCISLNSHFRSWRQALTHVEQGDGHGPWTIMSTRKSKAILNKLSLIQNSIFNTQLGHHKKICLPFKAKSTLRASTLIILFVQNCWNAPNFF
jgi:hypothetical protein